MGDGGVGVALWTTPGLYSFLYTSTTLYIYLSLRRAPCRGSTTLQPLQPSTTIQLYILYTLQPSTAPLSFLSCGCTRELSPCRDERGLPKQDNSRSSCRREGREGQPQKRACTHATSHETRMDSAPYRWSRNEPPAWTLQHVSVYPGSCAVAHALASWLLSHRTAPVEPPYPHRTRTVVQRD